MAKKSPPSKAATKVTMWATFGSAANNGWGSTVRLILIIVVLGTVLIGIIVASGGPELIGFGTAATAFSAWARSWT